MLGINHKEVADIFSRSLSIVSSDEDSAARIVRLDINQILVEIVRADGTAPKRWNWVTKAINNMAVHPRLRQSLIKKATVYHQYLRVVNWPPKIFEVQQRWHSYSSKYCCAEENKLERRR